jgi:spore coat polysaccharide biosynthesis protein SpsF
MPSKILIIVQARMSSSRFPQKVLKPILGESLLYRMIERLRQVQTPVEIVVATSTDPSDDVLVAHCQEKNIACFRGNLHDCLDRHYQLAKLYNADVAIKIPSDCPLIDPRIVDKTLQFFLETEGQFDFVSNLHPATYPDGNDVEIMTFEALERTHREATRPLEREHTTPYLWENPNLFRIANLTWETNLDYSMSHRFTIDYEADYLFIKRVYEELYPQNPTFSMNDILGLLSQKPEIYELNAQYAGVNWYRNHLDELKTVSENQTKKL